jgi:secreted PhoX family phosphatase
VGAAAVVGLGAAFWADLFGSARSAARSPRSGYGPRGPANELGLRLPEGFRSRLIARGGQPVSGTNYRWHEASDGMACFATDDGGWILVSNSEGLEGGASAVRFGADGKLRSAYRILDGTTQNCSGGPTPWGTWLSCEEVMGGLVWECDPAGRRRGLARPAMGTFKHEAAAVDPRGRQIYLTEDLMDGGVYRFTPTNWHDLSAGLLEIATVAPDGAVSWSEVPDPAARRVPTRQQVRGSTPFKRAEGIWHDDGTVYISTTGDHRVHAYDIARRHIAVIYDGLASADAPLLRVDQLTANRAGEVFVCEDIGTEEIDIGLIDRAGRVSRFLSATGPQHAGSELTGVTFDPSGRRMYFSSQRAFGRDGAPGPGAIYEVSGPFRGSQAFHPRETARNN